MLQSMELQRVRPGLVTEQQARVHWTHFIIHVTVKVLRTLFLKQQSPDMCLTFMIKYIWSTWT